MLEKFVRLVFGRFAIVACDSNVQIAWQCVASKRVDLLENPLRNERGVRALALCHRDRDAWVFRVCGTSSRSLCAGEKNVIVSFRWSVHNLFHDIPQVHWPSGMNSHDDLLEFFRPGKEVAGFDLKFLVTARKAAGLTARISGSELPDHGTRSQSVSGEALRVQHNTQLAWLPADDRCFGNVVQLFKRMFQFSRNKPQLVGVVVVAPKRQSKNRYIINRAHLDNRLRDSLRDAVEVRIELVIGLNNRIFLFRAYIEAHDHHAQAGMADRIDVLDSWYFAEQLFHGHGGALRYFFGGRPRHLHEHVQHGDDNLGFFLAWRLQDAKSSEKESSEDDQRC